MSIFWEDDLLDYFGFEKVAEHRSSSTGFMINIREANIQGQIITIAPGDWGWRATCGDYFHETCYIHDALDTLLDILIGEGILVESGLLRGVDLESHFAGIQTVTDFR